MTGALEVGIHDLSFATTEFVLPHAELAAHTGNDVDKYHIGIGQRAMSVPAVDEDVVTMAVAAAEPVVARHGSEGLRTVVFATETGIDQSKAAGVYVHSLLDLPSPVRVVEVKQACYSATAALQFADGLVRRDPSQRVLVLASDISKYDLDSPGEATQGAAAVAMLVGADPALVRFGGPSGLFTADVMDFWRPNHRTTALVDGRLSVAAYLEAVEGAWQDYGKQGGLPIDRFAAFCYHQPFTRMASKAHRHLLACCGRDVDNAAVEAAVGATTAYNAVVGNSYTASLYLGLASLLDTGADLDGAAVGLFSYGSGSVAEFFAGTVVPGHRDHLRTDAHRQAIDRRTAITYARYRALHRHALPTDGGDHSLPRETRGRFRLASVTADKRIYERT